MVKKSFFILTLISAVLFFARNAQAIEVTQTADEGTLGAALGGVNVTSVSGNAAQFGTFTNASDLWKIGNGIVLSSGKVVDYSDGPNTSDSFSTDFQGPGQADLTALSGDETFDAATLAFNFVAVNTQLTFDFVFGSDEYPEWVGSPFNDTFGAFLGGAGGVNVAFDQFSNPISINNVWMKPGTGTELDGQTLTLKTVYGGLNPGTEYSFMFGIADASDNVWDSTVYLSNFNFTSDEIEGTDPKYPEDIVPEPVSMLLYGVGGLTMAIFKRRRK